MYIQLKYVHNKNKFIKDFLISLSLIIYNNIFITHMYVLFNYINKGMQQNHF